MGAILAILVRLAMSLPCILHPILPPPLVLRALVARGFAALASFALLSFALLSFALASALASSSLASSLLEERSFAGPLLAAGVAGPSIGSASAVASFLSALPLLLLPVPTHPPAASDASALPRIPAGLPRVPPRMLLGGWPWRLSGLAPLNSRLGIGSATRSLARGGCSCEGVPCSSAARGSCGAPLHRRPLRRRDRSEGRRG
mmetsp:Transcript_171897/g.545761  ORF Transcript_171897/g.545761 Transcript_171897/m.545761 type:complete len:204 (-) Transcript_171897:94-705(-)